MRVATDELLGYDTYPLGAGALRFSGDPESAPGDSVRRYLILGAG